MLQLHAIPPRSGSPTPPRRGAALLLLAGVALAAPTPAMAYLNPDSGSMLLQALIGGAAGAAVAIRLLWRRIASLVRRDRGGPPA